jgi:hypothetical protein
VRFDWLALLVFLPLAACGLAITGSAINCLHTGNPNDCPQVWAHGHCVTGTLGCPKKHR